MPGACPKLFISETVKYDFIHIFIMCIYIRVLLRTHLALRDPISPGFMFFKKSSVPSFPRNSVRENIYLSVFQIVNKYDTSHSLYKSFDFSCVGENIYKNRRGHQATTNRGEWERERKVCRLVFMEGGHRLRRLGEGNVKKNG